LHIAVWQSNLAVRTFGIRRMFFCAFALCVLIGAAVAEEPPQAMPAGLRQISSKHLLLTTDLAPNEEIDALPGYFDQAFDQWCAYFGVDPAKHANWQARGHLIRSRERFLAAGLLPADIPLRTGYALGDVLWLLDQTSVYYRRHLLLHEGTHAFMHTILKGVGPPWYAEGMAELMATHQLDQGKLTLNVFPSHREDVSKWGRIEIVQTGFANRKAMTLAKVFAYGPQAHSKNDPYGWCWAAAAFFDGHPRYQARFRQLPAAVTEPDFNQHLQKVFADDWAQVTEDWQLFVANVDYGYDFARMEIDRTPGQPLPPTTPTKFKVAADRGWQNTGLAVAAGQKYQLRAEGRYQVADVGGKWISEPGGITIRYHHGQPLGLVMAAVRADQPAAGEASGLIKPIVVGLGTTLEPKRAGTLYLRINDSAGERADNLGGVDVEVNAASEDRQAKASN